MPLMTPTFRVGDTIDKAGMVTKNSWVLGRSASALEDALGYRRGRLSKGWFTLVLLDRLGPGDFELAGTTLRSDGREGLPAGTPEADRLRRRVHDTVMERGEAGYRDLQIAALRSVTAKGDDRIVKVLPMWWPDERAPPRKEYPMGGGALQWRLIRPKRFLVALHVDANGNAVGNDKLSVFFGESAACDARALVARHLREV